MPILKRMELHRSRLLPQDGGRTIFFHTQSSSRSRPQTFFGPQDVPEFEGDSAWFECERKGGRWHILRRVGGIRDA
jgi:hypothetical protein